MSRRNNNQNNQYYGNGQYYGNNQNGQYYGSNYNQNGQYYGNNANYNQNGQYYNQNQKGPYYGKNRYIYPSSNEPNQDDENKGISKDLLFKIGVFVLAALVLILIILAVNSCTKKAENEEDPNTYVDNTKVVGNDTLGYVTIPGSWVKFIEEGGTRALQYSSKDGTYIVTLDALSSTDISAEEYALGKANELKKDGVTNIKGATVTLGKYDAYEVYGFHDTVKSWVLVYFFEAEDGYTHFVGVEGPDQTSDAFRIPYSFSLTK